MTLENQTPIFEIDQPELFGQFFVSQRLEILAYLRALQAQRASVMLYIDDGRSFFLSSILAVDEKNELIFLDCAQNPATNQKAFAAHRVTLTANLDKVKIQLRLPRLEGRQIEGKHALAANLPPSLLRLQRREYFRLETPHLHALHCQLVAHGENGVGKVHDLPLLDISGGGLSLLAASKLAESFIPGMLFHDCRLLIPGEGAIPINLCIREILQTEDRNGLPHLRVGCEFCNIPGTRLSQIQRYITRLERERKARDAGLN